MIYKIRRGLLIVTTVLALALTAFGQCPAPSFDAAIVVPAGGPSGEIASGDLNGDLKTDLVIPRYSTNTISLIFGSATGSPTVVLMTSVQRPIVVGVVDLNHDGKLDLAISHETSPSTGIFVAVLLGDGAGGFGPPTDYTAFHSKPLVTADFNNDGNVDIFLGNSSTDNSEILFGNGTGGLAPSSFVSVPNHTHAVTADFNNDGKFDLATEYDGIDRASVVLGDGAGHFGAATSFPIGRPLFGNLAKGDFNNDGKVDLVTSGQNDGVSILLGNGTGGFAPSNVSTGFQTIGVAVGDFNSDGKLDVTATSSFLVAVLIGNGNGGFVSTTGYPTNETPVNVVTGDLNGDNKIDVGAVNCTSCSNAATILYGAGNGSLRSVKLLNVGMSPFAIASGDFNADTKVDLAVANISHNNVSILIGDGAGNFSPATNFAVGAQPRSVSIGDLNGDQKLDLVTANYDAGITILFGDGFGGFSAPNNRSVPGFNADYVAIGEFNNDSKPDLAVAYASSGYVSILLGDGAGAFGSAVNFPVPTNALQIAVHDFNGDGKGDLAVATVSGVSILLGNGAGSFGPANTMSTSSTVYTIAADDFNRDGNTDLVATLGNTTTALVYTGNGLGGFSAPVAFTTGSGPASSTLADFNGDRNSDLATGNLPGSASVLLGNGAGGFGTAVTYPDGSFTTRSITSGDFNSDGHPDLALANQPGSISILSNSCSAATLSIPSVAISDATVTEGESGTTTVTFNLNLSAPTDRTVSASFYTLAADAQKDVDYQTLQGRVSFAPGTTSQTIAVSIAGDLLDEFDEHFSVVLAYPLNASISRQRGQGTILDNDPPPTVSISDVSVSEGNSGTSSASFNVGLSAVSGKTVVLQYASADGSAVAGSDYAASSGSITIPAGSLSTTISIQVNGDTLAEPDETFFVNLMSADNAVIVKGQGTGTIVNDGDTGTAIQFSASALAVSEGNAGASVVVIRLGNTSTASTVTYTTSDPSGANNCNVHNGDASSRCDYLTTIGTLQFAAGETSKTITIPIIDDAYAESSESFNVTLSNPTGASLNSPSKTIVNIMDNDAVNGPNPIDQVNFFVRQHYLDFLNRDPDAPGLAYWANQITECQQPGATCSAEIRRINVSAAFFLSIEFQETGYLVERIYKTAYGDADALSALDTYPTQHAIKAPIIRLNEFLADSQQISKDVQVGVGNWEAQLEANKVAFTQDFVARSRFVSAYATTMTPAEFVDKLFINAGVTPSAAERSSIIGEFAGAGNTANNVARARALRRVAENSVLAQLERNKAFVLMQYFGYLRRNPDDPQDTDHTGYDFWLHKLDQFNGNFESAQMVKAFIDSIEYRTRFAP